MLVSDHVPVKATDCHNKQNIIMETVVTVIFRSL